MHRNRSFTLIELMIVVIIVGVLAAVAAPMMRKSIIRSKWSEAIAAMGTIRVAERVYYIEYGTYREIGNAEAASVGLNALGLKATDFDGTYFSNNSYTFINGSNRVTAYINYSTAPKASELRFNNSEMAGIYLNGAIDEWY